MWKTGQKAFDGFFHPPTISPTQRTVGDRRCSHTPSDQHFCIGADRPKPAFLRSHRRSRRFKSGHLHRQSRSSDGDSTGTLPTVTIGAWMGVKPQTIGPMPRPGGCSGNLEFHTVKSPSSQSMALRLRRIASPERMPVTAMSPTKVS